jgi:hypothetical protein
MLADTLWLPSSEFALTMMTVMPPVALTLLTVSGPDALSQPICGPANHAHQVAEI